MTPKWIEVFKAGTHENSAGEVGTWTREDIDTIIKNYAAGEDDVPAVIGHPASNSPAYGWVKELKRDGDLLLAKIQPTVKEFVSWVNNKLYNSVSISLRPGLKLRHVGFLGAAAPAIKGLAAPEFSEEEEYVLIEFETAKLSETTQDKEDQMTDAEKKKLQEYEELKKKVVSLEAAKKDLEKKVSDAEVNSSEFEELKKNFMASEEERKQARENLKQLRMNMRKNEFEQFLNQEVAWGSVNEKQAETAFKILEFLGGEQFSEDGEDTEGVKLFKEFLKEMPGRVEGGEIATQTSAGATEGKVKEFQEKVKEFQEKHDVDIKTATLETAAAHPELYRAANG